MATSIQPTTLQNVNRDEWERLAELANHQEANSGQVTADRLKEKYVRGLQEQPDGADGKVIVEYPQPQVLASGDIHVGPYEIKVYSVVSIAFEGVYHPGPDWSLQATVQLKAAGIVVWTTEYTLSRANPSISFHPTVGLAKADITVGLFGDQQCLRITGQGCYMSWHGWECGSFAQTLHCFAGTTAELPEIQAAASDIAEFTSTCGENSEATSESGLRVNQRVSINGSTDLSSCVRGNNGACVHSVSLSRISGSIYSYALNVEGQGPSGFGTGSFYLAFKDDTGAIYHLSLFDSRSLTHTVKFNTSNAVFHSFKWSNKSIPDW